MNSHGNSIVRAFWIPHDPMPKPMTSPPNGPHDLPSPSSIPSCWWTKSMERKQNRAKFLASRISFLRQLTFEHSGYTSYPSLTDTCRGDFWNFFFGSGKVLSSERRWSANKKTYIYIHTWPRKHVANPAELSHDHLYSLYHGWTIMRIKIQEPWMEHLAVCQNLVPLVNIKIAGKWMFIPLKMVLIGIDPYPFKKVEEPQH